MAKTVHVVMASPMANAAQERKPTDAQIARDHAKHSMRRATEDWVDGRITTEEHSAVHKRGQHILAGKKPHEFKGKSGERKHKGGLY